MQFAYKIGWEKHSIHQEEELLMFFGWAVGRCGWLPGEHRYSTVRLEFII